MKLKMASLIKFCCLFACIILGACLTGVNQVVGLVFLLIGIIGVALQAFNVLTIVSYDKELFNKSFCQFYKDRFINIKLWFSSLFGAKKAADKIENKDE